VTLCHGRYGEQSGEGRHVGCAGSWNRQGMATEPKPFLVGVYLISSLRATLDIL